jgi:hypothetical protein
LHDGPAELGDLSRLVGEEEIEESCQPGDVVDGAPHDLLAVLDQHGAGRVLEDDVVGWVVAAPLLEDLGVDVVLLVLRFPVAERDTQGMEQRAVDVSALLRGLRDLVFGDEGEVVPAGQNFQEILERLADDRFAVAPGNAAAPTRRRLPGAPLPTERKEGGSERSAGG